MIEILTAFIIASILFHELAHKIAYSLSGVKSVFIRKETKIFGKQIPTGRELHPKNYDYPVKTHILVAMAGFIGSIIVTALLFTQAETFGLQAGMIVFPFIISIYDFQIIAKFITSDWNMSVKQAHLAKLNQR